MLTKRTNILFEEDVWDKLVDLSRIQKTSVGNLVRKAIRDIYFSKKSANEEREAFEEILRIRKHFKGKIDYKALINEGRKY